MFDLNEALKHWKRSHQNTCGVEDLEELESHLLEHVDDLRETGLSEEEAFVQAVSRMGSPKDIGREFAKVRSAGDWVLDRFRALDLPLLLGLLLICGMGLTLIYSASTGTANGARLCMKQGVWMGLGFTLMFLVAQIKPSRLKHYTPFIYGVSILLLILAHFAGIQINGTRRWIRLGGLAIQPSMLMLLALPMMTAWLLTKREWANTWKGFTTMLAVILLPAMLVLHQPDIGMALLCLGAGWITLFLSACRARLVRLTYVALPALCAAGWLLLQPYQLQRVQAFLNPEMDPRGAGWHYLRVKEAISSGGFLGRGWSGHETIVPERHTDFILTVVAEQFGTVGVLAVMVCFAFLLYRAIVISKRSQDLFCHYLGLGFVSVLLMQLAINVSMVYGWMPIIGLPLPLVSYGGSSLVLLLVGFGILASIQRQQEQKPS